MRKGILLVLSIAVLCMFMSGAFAENVYNWTDVSQQAGQYPGSIVSLDGVPYKVWMPDAFHSVTLGEADINRGFVAYFTDDGQTVGITVLLEEYGLGDIEEYVYMAEEEGAGDTQMVTINGEKAVVYSIEETDASCVALLMDEGSVLRFIFWPMSDPSLASISQFITYSIQK